VSDSHTPASSYLTVIQDPERGREAWREAFRSAVASRNTIAGRDDVVGQNDLTPFQHPTFLDGLERIVPWKRLFLHAPGVGSASVFLRHRGPVRDIVLPPFCPFSAVIPDESAHASGSLLAASPLLPPTRLFSLPPGVEAAALGVTTRAEIKERFTYHLPSASPEKAIEGWSSSQRRSFRKHADDYLYVVQDQDALGHSAGAVRSDLVAVAALAAAGYARHGARLPLGQGGLVSLSEDMIRSGLGRLHVLKDSKGDTVAGVVALANKRMAWYWLAGSEPGPVMTVLLGHLQDALHTAGVPVLDLMGANTPGIAEFKRRFGGELKSYLHVRTASLAGRMAEKAARAFHRARS